MDDYYELLQQMAERTLTAKFSLWGALLTAHTVLLSVSVALLVTGKAGGVWQFKVGGFVAISCIVALLLTFWLTKSQYDKIGRRLSCPESELSESERNRDLNKALLRRRLCSFFEITAMLGLVLGGALFGWILAVS